MQARQGILPEGAFSSHFVTQLLRYMAFPAARFLPSAGYSLHQDAKVTRDVVKTPCLVLRDGEKSVNSEGEMPPT